MSVRPFLKWPDKRLRTAAAPVEQITDDIREIWADMVETMDAMPGLGLAGPQIGVMLQLAVVDVTPDRSRRILLANPEILQASSDTEKGPEGSPNLPGVQAEIIRAREVSVRYLGEDGVIQRGDFQGLSLIHI